MQAPDLDLESPANVRDPFPVHRWLREHDPVHRSEDLDAWVVTRYADLLEIFDPVCASAKLSRSSIEPPR